MMFAVYFSGIQAKIEKNKQSAVHLRPPCNEFALTDVLNWTSKHAQVAEKFYEHQLDVKFQLFYGTQLLNDAFPKVITNQLSQQLRFETAHCASVIKSDAKSICYYLFDILIKKNKTRKIDKPAKNTYEFFIYLCNTHKMPPIKKDFDLTDKGWVDLYVKKCESIMKEFTNYVYALQHHCAEERSRSERLEKDCKFLQIKVAKLNKEQEVPRKQCNDKIMIRTPEDRCGTSSSLLGNQNIQTPNTTDADRTTISDGSPAFLNMAMDSEQLQIDTTCILSPAQHRQELITASEQLNSPPRLTTTLDSIFQHNTSPTCKAKNNNENKSALGFLKARGRVGKILLADNQEPKLREHNYTSSEEDNAHELRSSTKGKLQAKHSDWLGKNTKIDDRRAALKRASTSFDDILKKRALLSLNKSSERKLKQSRLTQIVGMKANKLKNETASTSPEDVVDAQKLKYSPTSPGVPATSKKQLPFPSFSTDSDDIFHFSSDDEEGDDDNKDDKVAADPKRNVEKPIDATFLQPLPRDTEKCESVLAISPTAPPIICLDVSECNEIEDENRLRLKPNIKVEPRNNLTETCKNGSRRKKSNGEKLPTELAAAMLAEWEEEVENEEEFVNEPKLQIKLESKATIAAETKPRLSQLPIEKICIKECFNIDCDECQKYIDFMGSNMSMAEIEAHLRRCTLHRTTKDCLPVTPPGYWNPLMPSFTDSDPRNKTLLEDPFLQRKRNK